MLKKYTLPELFTCIIARELKDYDKVAIGLYAEMFLLAGYMAQKLSIPKLKIRHDLHYSLGELNPAAWTPHVKSKEFQNISYYEQHEAILSDDFCTLFFVSGLQIDKDGNTNLIGIKSADGSIKLRGPGSIGTSSIAQRLDRYIIFSFEHSKRRFVEQCDFISTIGYPLRKKYGLKGGPSLIITPLCVFEFVNGKIRLKSIHPHSSLDEITQKTGFDFIIDNHIITKEPTKEEVNFIRTFDKHHSLKEYELLMVY